MTRIADDKSYVWEAGTGQSEGRWWSQREANM